MSWRQLVKLKEQPCVRQYCMLNTVCMEFHIIFLPCFAPFKLLTQNNACWPKATLKRLRENNDCLKNSQLLLLSKIVVCYIWEENVPFYFTLLALTNIRFDEIQAFPHRMFELNFHKNNAWYVVHASDSGVTASPVSHIYVLIQLPSVPVGLGRSV